MGMMSRGAVGLVVDGIELDSNGIGCDLDLDLAFYMSTSTDKNVVGYATSTVHFLILCKGNRHRQTTVWSNPSGNQTCSVEFYRSRHRSLGVAIDVLLVASRGSAREAVRDSTTREQSIVLV